jgi:NADH-quinone oxidoreductase subunit C
MGNLEVALEASFNYEFVIVLFAISNIWFMCKNLVDFFGMDAIGRKTFRFNLFLIMRNSLNLKLMKVKAMISEFAFSVSFKKISPMIKYLEREIWDMYGIFFNDNNDQRRILSDYGFHGYPLRKDFPTTGFLEIRYDEELVRIVKEPLALTQIFRLYDFLSPWRTFYSKI